MAAQLVTSRVVLSSTQLVRYLAPCYAVMPCYAVLESSDEYGNYRYVQHVGEMDVLQISPLPSICVHLSFCVFTCDHIGLYVAYSNDLYLIFSCFSSVQPYPRVLTISIFKST
jgi:hypothetical protein